MPVVDNFNSTSSTDSLSARCGNVLNTRIDEIDFTLLDIDESITNLTSRVTTLENSQGTSNSKTILW